MAESFDLDYDAVGATAASGGAKKPAVKRKLRKLEQKEGIEAQHVVQSADSITGSALRGGYLQKRSEQGFLHNWKRRWVALVGEGLLYYFEDEHSKKPRGTKSVRSRRPAGLR